LTLPLSVNLMAKAPVDQIVDLAVLAEDLGCSRCWVYDEGLVTRDVYVTLAAIATRTERIAVGPGITNPYVRHPGATATAIATLDELSGGRAFVGLGAGGGLTLGPLGIDRHKPLTAVAQTVEALRALFAGQRVTQDGETFSLTDAHLDYGRSDIEIILAGRGPKMIQLGGGKADGFYLSYIHKDLLADHMQSLRQEAAGRSFHITYSTMVATTDAEYEAVRAQLTFRLVDSPAQVKSRIGMSDDDTARIRAALADGGPNLAAEHVKPEWVPSFAIVGTPEECGRELTGLLATHGIDEFQIPVQDIDHGADLIERTAALFPR